jgi:IclR family transcriptional regulator, pca regulon regulatory protein
MATEKSEAFVRALARGLRVIEVLGQGEPRQTVAAIAQSAALPRSVVKRFVMTLSELGFTRTDGRYFWLTPRVLALGLSYLYSLPFWRQAQFALEELSGKIKQSCAMSVLDGAEIVYVVRVPTYKILRTSPTLGSRLPAHVVSMGRVLLADKSATELKSYFASTKLIRFTHATITDPLRLTAKIEQTAKQGFAWVDAELDESICGLAIPVRNAEGIVVAAINVSLPSGKFSEGQAKEKFLVPLRHATAQIRSTMPGP